MHMLPCIAANADSSTDRHSHRHIHTQAHAHTKGVQERDLQSYVDLEGVIDAPL